MLVLVTEERYGSHVAGFVSGRFGGLGEVVVEVQDVELRALPQHHEVRGVPEVELLLRRLGVVEVVAELGGQPGARIFRRPVDEMLLRSAWYASAVMPSMTTGAVTGGSRVVVIAGRLG
ncbi:hypothetical protein I3W98_19495 [Streptomyces cavourensis]|nr:hypothetical protein [Streptomyces cavourensis]